jgi:hypothetical protein
MDFFLLVRSSFKYLRTSLIPQAFALAVGHGLLFQWLNGTLAEHRRLGQSQITAISLLITTAFKACAIGAISLSFAQHLWHVIRRKALKIARIEQLFSIRSNPFELAKVGIVRDTPLLLLMALTVWLISIAAIYPPSALTTVARPYSTTIDTLMSTLSPSVRLNSDHLFPAKPKSISLFVTSPGMTETCDMTRAKSGINNCEIYCSYRFVLSLSLKCSTLLKLTELKISYTISSHFVRTGFVVRRHHQQAVAN